MTAKAYVFDAYGTLFDVHAAVRKHADAVGPITLWCLTFGDKKQLEYTWIRTMADRYLDFWELTQQALDFALERVPSANKNARKDLLDAYWTLDCFEEVPAVLGQLKKAGKRVGILSNGSSPMLEAAVSSAGLSDVVDDVISVDRLSKFKVTPAVYKMVTDDFSMDASEIAFQSSNRWDLAAAKNFGFTANWINRSGQPDEYADMPADLILSDLRG